MPKHGPYVYASAADIATKVFTSDDGGKRTFTIVRASAYDAGIIGTEHNGVAVIDEDHRQILFDRAHCDSEMHLGIGAEAHQKNLMRQLIDSDWTTFTTLVRNARRYRGDEVFQDGRAEEPSYIRPMAAEDDWQVLDISSEGPEDDPYVYPSQTRSAIIAELLKHAVHRDSSYAEARFAWNIKITSTLDTSGAKHAREFTPEGFNPELDAEWNKHVATDPDLFGACANDALSMYLDNEYTVYPGEQQGDFHFGVEGRSGGWLVLDKIDDVGALHFQSMNDMENQLHELDRDELKKLYVAITQLDHDLQRSKIIAEMEYQYAYQRTAWEADRVQATASPR